MVVKYRTAGDWGAGEGRLLFPEEVDENFWSVVLRLVELEESPNVNLIQNFTVVGDQLTILMDDGSTFGPYTLPATVFTWRGDWASTTSYSAFDVVTVEGSGLYLVLNDHTSEAAFDPDAVSDDTEALPFYHKMFGVAGLSTVVEDITGDYNIDDTEPSSGSYLRVSAVGAESSILITLESRPEGFELRFRQVDSSQLEFIAGAGVTLIPPDAVSAWDNAVVTAKSVLGGTAWDIWGDLGELATEIG